MNELRKRGYLTEEVPTIDSCQVGGMDVKKGTASEAMREFYKSFLGKMVSALSSSMLKRGEKAVVSASSWGFDIRGKGEGFEWSINMSRNSFFNAGFQASCWISIMGETKTMTMNMNDNDDVDEFCADVAAWFERKIAAR